MYLCLLMYILYLGANLNVLKHFYILKLFQTLLAKSFGWETPAKQFIIGKFCVQLENILIYLIKCFEETQQA